MRLLLIAVLLVPRFVSFARGGTLPLADDLLPLLDVQSEEQQHILSSAYTGAYGMLRRFSADVNRVIQFAEEYDLDVWHASAEAIDIYAPPSDSPLPDVLQSIPHTSQRIPIPPPLLPRARLSSPIYTSSPSTADSDAPVPPVPAPPPQDKWNLTLGLAQTTFHNTYHPLFEIDAFVHALAAMYPNRTRVVSVGHSALGREMWALSVGEFGEEGNVTRKSVNIEEEVVVEVKEEEAWDIGQETEEEEEDWEVQKKKSKSKKNKKKGGNKKNPKPDPSAKLGFVIVGAQHAREWIATATSLYLAHALLADPTEEHSLNKLLEVYDFHFIPVPNPDGYDYTWEADRFWYKNRQNFGPKTKCVGLDMNRNWGYKWKPAAGDVGSFIPSSSDSSFSATSANFSTPSNSNSSKSCPSKHSLKSKVKKPKKSKKKKPTSPVDPCSHWYPGARAFEAPETNNIANFVGSLGNEQVVGFLDLRSYGQMLSAPYSFSCKRIPKDAEDQMEAALGATQALKMAHGTAFKTGTLCSMLYRAPGNILDWMYSRAGIKYSYVAHLRDTGTYGFSLPERWIRPVGEETANMVAYIAKFVAKKMNRSL